MNNLVRIVLLILFFAFLAEIVVNILKFMGIQFEQYAPYIAWFYALMILVAILPDNKSEIFN